MRGWQKTLAQVLASGSLTVGLLAAAEGALALAGLPPDGLYAGDPASVWWLRPGLDRVVDDPLTGRQFRLRTDAHGRRGPPPPAAGPWVLAMGCSTTLGWGVEAEEAWPAQLAAQTGRAVVNAGQPGWSTHQALAHGSAWFDDGPETVVLGFLIRDAWRAGRADKQARPTPWLHRRRLARLLRPTPATAAAATAAAAPPTTGAFRVSPADYGAQLRALADAAAPARTVFLAFPHQHETAEHEAVLAEVAAERGAPLVRPRVEAGAWLAGDPIHLGPGGLAQVAAAVGAALDGRP